MYKRMFFGVNLPYHKGILFVIREFQVLHTASGECLSDTQYHAIREGVYAHPAYSVVAIRSKVTVHALQ